MPAAVRDRLVSVETQPLLGRRRCSIFHLFRETLTPHEASLLQSGITRNEHSLRRLGLLNCAGDWPNHLLMSILQESPSPPRSSEGPIWLKSADCLVRMGRCCKLACTPPILRGLSFAWSCVLIRLLLTRLSCKAT